MNNSSSSPSKRISPRSDSNRRPASIAELAEKALINLWDPSESLKLWLKTADGYRKAGKECADRGDLEGAFVHYAKAATLVLEKLPTHREYTTSLSASQRHNLGLNGQMILDSLSELKPILVARYERWLAQHRDEDGLNHPGPPSTQPYKASHDDRQGHAQSNVERQQTVVIRDEPTPARLAAAMSKDPRSFDRDTVLALANQAAQMRPQSTSYYSENPQQQANANFLPPSVAPPDDARRNSDWSYQQEKMKGREEEIVRSRQHREQDRSNRNMIPPVVTSVPTAVNFSAPSSANAGTVEDIPVPLPLESPTRRQGDSTPARSSPYANPVTTTSPPPVEGPVRYPQIMSQHQLKQGYTPSLQSMFHYPTLHPGSLNSSSLLFVPEASHTSALTTKNLYTPNALPHSSVPVIPQALSYSYSLPSSVNSTPDRAHLPPPPQAHGQHVNYPSPYPLPTLQQNGRVNGGDRHRTPSQESARIVRPAREKADAAIRELKTVVIPRECLSRFLSIAALNTSRNRETCGLLLGKDKGHKFVVTTLLIPRQHSTSDTCTMDEEELVMQFTEERSLITLGWIHTHPSQSCFMSSVDLHTHSGFQRMLPESFAIVCAPKSTPNFGIFRLTDPPGLQTILQCKAKEAFHPHQDLPIYTDADKGHVQMKDVPLEIVDLR